MWRAMPRVGAACGGVPFLLLMTYLVTMVLIGSVSGVRDDSTTDEEDFSGAGSDAVVGLQEQIKALLEHRRTLDKELDTIKIANQIELTALREEIENLRRDVNKDSSTPGHSSNNQQRNDHLTVQWLQSAVQQIRTEIQTELTASHNASELHAQAVSGLSSDVSLLRSDVDSCRADLELLRRDAELNTAQNQQYSEEITNIRDKAQSCAASCANLRVQLETAQSEWSSVLKPKRLLSPGDNRVLDTLEKFAPVERSPKEVERRLRRVEKHLKTAMWSHAKSASRESEHKELLERVSQLEGAGRTGARKFFNLTRDIAAIDKVQKSAAQLKEQVGALEGRLDTTIPELQKEVTKMEFELAQTSSNAQVAKDNQEVQSKSLKNLMDLVSGLQDGLDENRALISVLKHGALSSSASSLMDEPSGSEISSAADRSVKRVVRDLGRIEKDYWHIVRTLPRDCQNVKTGSSGEYLIAPPLAPEERSQEFSNAVEAQFDTPVMAYCDQKSGAGGWTVVQRRTDGSDKFNRGWAEYRAGFGSPGGEFWLGNAAIRRLTADNCSSLRVDLHDIYGQTWFAEYTEFSVGPEEDGYRLWVDGYQGNASDAFEYQNHMQFSTIDSDRDISNTNCAASYEGGWWFSHCQHVNLNGRYSLGLTWFDSVHNEWIAVAWSELKVRRRADCGAPGQSGHQQLPPR